MIKKILMVCLSLAACFSIHAQERPLIVAVDTNFKPFAYKDPQGTHVGYDLDVWAAIAEKLGVSYQIRPMDFNGIIPGIQTSNLDVAIAAMSLTAKREEVIDFSYPYYKAGLTIMVMENNQDIHVLEDLTGKTVATKLGTSTIPFLNEHIAAGRVKPREVKEFPNITDAFLELRAGRTDAVLFDLPPLQDYAATVGKGMVKLVGPLYLGHHYGIGMPKGSPWRKPINVALLELYESGRMSEIHQKWFGTDIQ